MIQTIKNFIFARIGSIYISYILISRDAPYFIATLFKVKLEKTPYSIDPASDKICIFILYQKHDIPNSVITQLSWIKKLGYSTHIISHTPLNINQIEKLTLLSFKITIRPNIGYDFGGYKYGILDFLKTYKNDSTRLLMANDSVFFPIQDPTELYSDIDNAENDFWSFSENWEIHHHLPSFFLVFKPAAFKHKNFQKFWKNYIPFSNRKHAINKGEVKLTFRLKKGGLTPGVALTVSNILEKLRAIPTQEIKDLYLRRASFDKQQVLLTKGQGKNLKRLLLLSEMGSTMEEKNISHHDFLLINYLTNFPILKKDIVYKVILPLHTIMTYLRIDEGVGVSRKDIEDFYRKRGKITEKHNWFKRILAAGGYH